MEYIEEMFRGLIALVPVQRTEKEVLLSLKAVMIRDQKMPTETGISAAIADAVRLINELSDRRQELADAIRRSKVTTLG